MLSLPSSHQPLAPERCPAGSASTEGLNAFQPAAGEAQCHGAAIIFMSPDRQIAAGAHRFDEAEIKQFLHDFLCGPASQARR